MPRWERPRQVEPQVQLSGARAPDSGSQSWASGLRELPPSSGSLTSSANCPKLFPPPPLPPVPKRPLLSLMQRSRHMTSCIPSFAKTRTLVMAAPPIPRTAAAAGAAASRAVGGRPFGSIPVAAGRCMRGGIRPAGPVRGGCGVSMLLRMESAAEAGRKEDWNLSRRGPDTDRTFRYSDAETRSASLLKRLLK